MGVARPRTRRSTPAWPLAIALLGAGGCGSSPPPAPAPAPVPGRSLTLVVSGDTAGWLTPCGCTANQSGGLARRGTIVGRLRETREVVAADAGGAPGGTSTYDRLKFEAILAGEKAMNVVAHNLGGPEAALGAEALRDLKRRLAAPFVSANLRDGSGDLIAPPVVEVDAGGTRLALVGVVSPGLVPAGLRADPPRDAVLRSVQGRKFDALVVLAYLPEPELRRLAAELPEADLVVGGPTGQSLAPIKAGPGWLASATNKGKFLVRMDRERGSTRWTGRVVEVSPDTSDDPEQRRVLDRFRDELAARDLRADETAFVPRLPPGIPAGYAVAGTAACRECHRAEAELWDHSGHAHAWARLRDRRAHVDPQCQSCHTTGYGLPGGFLSIARGAERTAVGCESCHGPARGHVSRSSERTPFDARGQCISCHDAENSPHFAFEAYWQKIRHGPRAPGPPEARP